jgi:hypothetical protein
LEYYLDGMQTNTCRKVVPQEFTKASQVGIYYLFKHLESSLVVLIDGLGRQFEDHKDMMLIIIHILVIF